MQDAVLDAYGNGAVRQGRDGAKTRQGIGKVQPGGHMVFQEADQAIDIGGVYGADTVVAGIYKGVVDGGQECIVAGYQQGIEKVGPAEGLRKEGKVGIGTQQVIQRIHRDLQRRAQPIYKGIAHDAVLACNLAGIEQDMLVAVGHAIYSIPGQGRISIIGAAIRIDPGGNEKVADQVVCDIVAEGVDGDICIPGGPERRIGGEQQRNRIVIQQAGLVGL